MRVIVAFYLLLLAVPSFAIRYEEAIQNYNKKNYNIAREQFLELAELGNKDAQFMLGVIYAYGYETKTNPIDAFAWIALSASEGHETYVKTLSEVKKTMTSDQLQKGKVKLSKLNQEYGDKALARKILPQYSAKIGLSKFTDRKPLRKKPAKYPRNALNLSLNGKALIEYIVGDDGRVKYSDVMESTNKLFHEESLDASLAFLYRPAQVENKNVITFSVSTMFTFVMSEGEVQSEEIHNYLRDLRSNALEGSSIDRFKFASQSRVLKPYLEEQHQDDFSNTWKWMTLAAKDGLPNAKYHLGKDVLYGEQCTSDVDKSFFWLESAANDGYAKAQMFLGMERYYGARFEKNEKQGIYWLEKAAQQSEDAKIELAVALATSSENSNISRAIELIEMVSPKKIVDKVSYYEAAAITYTKAKLLKKEEKSLKKLKKYAKKYDLPYEKLVENIDRRIKGEPIIALLET